MRWFRLAAPASVLAAWLAVSFGQQGTPPPGTPPPGAPPPAGTPPPPAAPAPDDAETERDAAPRAEGDESDEVFIPTEELAPDAAVTFPVDI